MRIIPLTATGRTAVRSVVTLALATALVIAVSAVASAAFRGFGASGHTIATATLAPPTNPATAAGSCTLLTDSIVVSWTKTASTWADGYQVLSSTTNGGPYTVAATVAGRDTQTATISGLPFVTTHYFVVRATKAQWRSTSTAQVARTTRTLCA